jgi:hypothetical protein
VHMEIHLYKKSLHMLFKKNIAIIIAKIVFYNYNQQILYIWYFILQWLFFHNQNESNYISTVSYITVIVYDSIIISLTHCFLNISHDALCYRYT